MIGFDFDRCGGIGQLTVFALALLDLRLVLDALVARLAVEPGPGANAITCQHHLHFEDVISSSSKVRIMTGTS